jgi:hypothetical protein
LTLLSCIFPQCRHNRRHRRLGSLCPDLYSDRTLHSWGFHQQAQMLHLSEYVFCPDQSHLWQHLYLLHELLLQLKQSPKDTERGEHVSMRLSKRSPVVHIRLRTMVILPAVSHIMILQPRQAVSKKCTHLLRMAPTIWVCRSRAQPSATPLARGRFRFS